MSGPTKAELQAELARVRAERDAVRSNAVTLDPEAKALSECVKALDVLSPPPRDASYGTSGASYSVRFGSSHNRVAPRDRVKRILLFLADRYGLEFADTATDGER